jgi:uncharacterized membrane protein
MHHCENLHNISFKTVACYLIYNLSVAENIMKIIINIFDLMVIYVGVVLVTRRYSEPVAAYRMGRKT